MGRLFFPLSSNKSDVCAFLLYTSDLFYINICINGYKQIKKNIGKRLCIKPITSVYLLMSSRQFLVKTKC